MRLRDARICLDCDEVHDATLCPACGSESFTYISRWVPVPDSDRPQRREPTEQTTVYRELLEENEEPVGGRKFLRGGLLGLTALGIAGWAWRTSRHQDAGDAESSATSSGSRERKPAGERKPSGESK